MKIAYADPPYFGLASFYKDRHPKAMDWDKLETHRDLIGRLCSDFPDGWAMSLHSPSLKDILPLCPRDARVAAWVKPFASFKPGVNPAYAWEPVIFRGGRKRDKTEETVRDWTAVSITLRKGLVGAKPKEFAFWLFAMMGMRRGDELEDLFPGTGAVTDAWKEWTAQLRFA